MDRFIPPRTFDTNNIIRTYIQDEVTSPYVIKHALPRFALVTSSEVTFALLRAVSVLIRNIKGQSKYIGPVSVRNEKESKQSLYALNIIDSLGLMSAIFVTSELRFV